MDSEEAGRGDSWLATISALLTMLLLNPGSPDRALHFPLYSAG